MLESETAMERVSRLIGNLRVAEQPLTPEQVVLSAWPRAVGKKLAANTRAIKLIRTRLVIEVEDEVWRRNLFTLSRQILAAPCQTRRSASGGGPHFQRCAPPP